MVHIEMDQLEVRELTFDSIEEYLQVSIAFHVKSRLIMETDRSFCEKNVEPNWVKDYDQYENEGPRSYASRFDVSQWKIFGVYDKSSIIGGAILAFRCDGFDLLQGRNDLVHIADFRVTSQRRGQGIGRILWIGIETWAREHGAIELHVETQDINVPASRFYQSMGCSLLHWSKDAYGADMDEAQLIWRKYL